MKERRGPFGLVVGGIVDSVVQTARRRTQDREPRALVYAADGRPRLVRRDDPGCEALLVTAGELIDLVGVAEPDEAGDAAADGDAAEDAAAAEAQTRADARAAGADDPAGETSV